MSDPAVSSTPGAANPAHGQPGHQHTGPECCSHHEIRFENWILVYFVGFMFVFTSTVSGWFGWVDREVGQIPALIGAILLGLPLFMAAGKEVMRGRPTTSSLAAIAVIALIGQGMYEGAGYVSFILLVVDQALRRTAWGARRAIEDLVKLTPGIARLVDNGEDREVPLEEIQVGMVVRVRPGENLPVDGKVIVGNSMINQASLTGEALPVEVEPGSDVYAGTTNLSGAVDVRVTSVGEDTTIGKVAALIHEAESSRTPRQLMIEQVARYFVPVALVVAGLVWWLTKDAEQAIAVLIVVCPTALLISSPVAMMAAFAAAARLGILIKQTSYLEAAADADTFVLDKTGTLTTGNFVVGRLAPADGVEGAVLLQAAADAEQNSNHPLARSIMQTARQARIKPAENAQTEEVHGHGVRTRTGAGEVVAGRATWIGELNRSAAGQIAAVEKKIEGMSGVHVMRDGKYLGAVGLEDKLRYNAKEVIDRLRELGARSIYLLTGDRFAVAKRVGITVGVDQIEAECLPEEKHALVRRLVEQGARVVMVGDGINDGPSLAAADVGVAMGLAGSDIATNSAGVALMNDDVGRIPFLVLLARKTRTIVAQNIAASVIIALIGLIVAATGQFQAIKGGLVVAALYHFIGDIFVLANSFRLIRFGEDFAVQEGIASPTGAGARPGAEAKPQVEAAGASAPTLRPAPVVAG